VLDLAARRGLIDVAAAFERLQRRRPFIPGRDCSMRCWRSKPPGAAESDHERRRAIMRHGDFRIGAEFRCGDRLWRCTDIGTRTIVAIRIDRVEVGGSPALRRTLRGVEAAAEGWFNGPPYAVAESVFDENDIESCSPEPGEED
jgi:hypothetical protein